jgi:hypothetical protein
MAAVRATALVMRAVAVGVMVMVMAAVHLVSTAMSGHLRHPQHGNKAYEDNGNNMTSTQNQHDN